MEQLEILNQIQTKEQEAKRIVEEAKRKASSMIKEAKFTKRKELRVAQLFDCLYSIS